MKTTVMWNGVHDMAAIKFLGDYTPQEPPSMPVNHILECMYNANREDGTGLQFYMYEIWDNDKLVGILMAESMDLEEKEMLSLFKQVLESEEAAPNTGRYERKVFDA